MPDIVQSPSVATPQLLGVSRRAWIAVGGFLALYVSWQLFRWLPIGSEQVADVWFVPLGIAGAVAALRADGSHAVHAAWRLIAFAWVVYLAGVLVEGVYQLGGAAVPYPSLADIGYLAFYPLAFLGLLRFPARRSVRVDRVRFVLDLVIVSLGAGAVAWYFVLGPYIDHDGHGLAATLTTVAYPLGDGLLVVGLVSRLLRGTTAESCRSLALLWGGVAAFVTGDLVYQYLNSHGAYHSGNPVDVLWMIAQALVLVAALAQRPCDRRDDQPAAEGGQAGWLPYLAVALGLAVLIASDAQSSFYRDLSVALIASVLAVLLIARQLVSQQAQRETQRQLDLVAALGRRGLAGGDLHEFFRESAERVAAELEVQFCAVLRFEPEARQLRMVAGVGWPQSLQSRMVVPVSADTQGGYTMLSDAPVVIGDLREDDRFPGAVMLHETGIVSGVTTPIRGRDGRFGLLAAHSERPRRFSAGEVTFLDSVAGVLGAAADRAATEDQIRQHAMYDQLTGLPNRALFADRVHTGLAASRRQRRPLALLFIDLDHFKNINDSLGHGAGDEVLQRATARLAEQLRAEDTLARLGGDEFAVLIPEVASLAAAEAVAERLLAALRVPLSRDDGRQLVIGASIGIAISNPVSATTAEVLERNADLAMYAAKNAGRGQVRAFEPAMHAHALRQLELSGELRGAVDRLEFELRYQPIVSLGVDGVTGVEALVRWRHPRHGLLSPAEFIGLAEENGQIVPMGRFVLREACAQLGRWRRELAVGDELTMAVNVSATQLKSPDLVSDVIAALHDAAVPPSSLILEITESVLIRGNGIAEALATLHDLGVRLAVDDFGTGYSALGYLHRYPFDILKIDKSFIDGLGTSLANDQLVQGIISLARCLEMRTIAEGVETARQARLLRAMSAGLAQGFHFGEPAPADALVALLAPANGRRRPLTPAAPVRRAEAIVAAD